MQLKSLLVAMLIATSAPPVVADGLILRDGSRLETQGPWRVQGRQVILTLSNGTLASIATRDVDLERSQAGLSPVPTNTGSRQDAPPRPAPKPVLVLTDRDLSSAVPSTHHRAVESSSSAPATDAAVYVEFWASLEVKDIDGVEIRGVLRNPGSTPVRLSWTEVEIVDSDGRVIRQHAMPHNSLLDAGKSTSFRVRFPDLGQEHEDPGFSVFTDDEPGDRVWR